MAHTNSNPVYNINADIISLSGHTVAGNEIDITTDSGQDVRFNQDIITTGSMRSELYARKEGELWAVITNNAIEFQKPVDFQNVTLSNVGGLTLPQSTLNNISITTSQVSSQNYNGQNLEHELDALTTAQNTILARTQGLTTNKIMKSNGSGILAVSSLTEANVNTLSGNETVSGNKTHSGDITISDLTASRLVMTDGNKKLVSSIAPTAINTLADNQTISGNKTHSGDITISDLTASKLVLTDGNKKLVSGLAETDLFRLGVTSNQFVGADTATVFAMTQSSDETYATSFLRMSCGSSSATEMGLQITNNTQSLNFTDSINLKNLNGDAIIGQVKNDGINIVSGKTYQINGSQIASANLSDTANIVKLNTSENNFTGVVDASSFKQGNSALNFSHLAGTASTGQIPSLASSKITSGTLAVARIPSLPASQLTSGTIADARLPTTLLKTTTAETIINTGNANGTNFHVRHSSNFQGAPSISVEDYNATGSQLQAGTLTLDSDDVAIKNSDSDGGVVFYNNNTSFLGRLDNTGMNIKSGLSYKVDGVALAVLSTSSQTIQGFKTFSNGISSANQTTITGTCTLNANTTVSAGRTTALKATEVVGNLTTNSGNVDITGNVGIDGNLIMDTGHDITKTGDSAGGVFARLVSLEANRRLKHIAPNLVVSSSYVMYIKFWSLPMNSGYAKNDYITGTGDTTTPQTNKYNNHYQTVFDGTVGTDLTDFTRTQSSVSGSAYSIDLTAPSSYYSPSGQTLTNLIINGTGYINWGHSSFPSSIRGKYNKMIRIGHYINDAVRIIIDGQPVVWSKYSFSQSISGTGNDNFNSVCVVRGDVSAIEVIYMAGAGSNYLTLQFNVMAAWD